MSTEPLQQAIESTKQVLGNVKPDHMESNTPCASWKVSDVVNHVVGGQAFFTNAMGGSSPLTEGADHSAEDYAANFDAASKATLAAFSQDGAMEKMVTLPFGDMPGAAFAGLAATDTFVHGWDLAKATGQSTDLNPALAEHLLEGAKQNIKDTFRGPDGSGAPFGPKQEAPAGAFNADKLAAFLGRII